MYDFYFMIGENWSADSAEFEKVDFYRAEGTLPFKSTAEGNSINYSQWMLSLEEASTQGAAKVSVPREDFPELK